MDVSVANLFAINKRSSAHFAHIFCFTYLNQFRGQIIVSFHSYGNDYDKSRRPLCGHFHCD